MGLPKTGGRKNGTPNRSTLVLREKLAALGCDPVEELVKIAREFRNRHCTEDEYLFLVLTIHPPRTKTAELK